METIGTYSLYRGNTQQLGLKSAYRGIMIAQDFSGAVSRKIF
jgi:hypothetical protein